MADDTSDDELDGIRIITRAEADAESKRPRGRPRKDAAPANLVAIPGGRPSGPSARDFAGGVTVNFLSEVFDISRPTVKKRLGDLAWVGERKKGEFLYPFRSACERILKPEIKPSFPSAFLDDPEFWTLQSAKMGFAIQSGQLWPRERVIASLAGVLKPVRERLLSLEETVEKARRDGVPVSDVVRSIMTELEANMQRTIIEDPLKAYRQDFAEDDGDCDDEQDEENDQDGED